MASTKYLPAGKLRTPAPTIDFTKLNMSADIVPSPPDVVFAGFPSKGSSISAAATDMRRLGLGLTGGTFDKAA